MAKTTKHWRVGAHLINIDNQYLPVVAPVPAVLANLCQVVSAAETTDAYQGPDVDVEGGVWIRFGSTCSGYGYYSGGSTVPSTARYELAPGDQIWAPVSNMSELYFAASSTDGTFYLAQA
jgi:hypothetical protein